ncbi:unnamed protein product [Enterobius vermicularis]|uniref:Small ribosomal subunit protein uS15m n=1 Tax=Enterobius vermicularis TaxID=51028 RepID=A0A0N4VHF0_ENTVE|nr:unnamed protein product [Enterobius vermicularis]
MALLLRRPFHSSTGYWRLRLPSYYRHKKATDPQKQDAEYYEKAARALPLDDHYIDNLKLLYEDKVAYEKDLRYKAEDLLVGRSPSDWLPKIDLALPRVGYEEIDVLSKAPDSVKRIFSVGYGTRRDLTDAWKKALTSQVRKHALDKSSLEMKIAWLTALIRHWSLLVEEIDNKPRKPRWLFHKIKLAIDCRRKFLRLLRETDSEAFEKAKDLKIAYIVPKLPEETVENRRKAWVEAQLTKRVEKEKEARLAELHEKFLDGIEEFDRKTEERLTELEEEKKKLLKRIEEISAEERGFSETNVPKYYPHVIGSLSELMKNIDLFGHPPPTDSRRK